MASSFVSWGDATVADEVLQEVYVRVWQRAGDFDTAAGSPITWLAAIARNLALDEARRKTATIDRGLSRRFCNCRAATIPRPIMNGVRSCDDCMPVSMVWSRRRKELVLLAYYYGMTREEISAGSTGRWQQ